MAKKNANGTWTLTDTEYDELLERGRKLSCLEGGGVDNWDGYDWAMEAYREGEDE